MTCFSPPGKERNRTLKLTLLRWKSPLQLHCKYKVRWSKISAVERSRLEDRFLYFLEFVSLETGSIFCVLLLLPSFAIFLVQFLEFRYLKRSCSSWKVSNGFASVYDYAKVCA
ncbi:hypothetical protein M406DRAFT_104361, partial [Cryphonectria parasitica EP155]